MLYGRFGDEIEVVGRYVSRQMSSPEFVRIKYKDDGSEEDAHVAYLRADEPKDLYAAIDAAPALSPNERLVK